MMMSMLLLIEFQLLIICLILLSSITSFLTKKKDIDNNYNHYPYAVVTLVTGNDTPYLSGALALGQSLIDSNTRLDMIVMVTPDVTLEARKSLSMIWIVKDVDHFYCNHKHNLDSSKYDLNGDQYKKGINRWSTTCTKFRAWQIKGYKRIIFMDSDTLVLGYIDNALFSYSNASLVAAPESFPPDTFNSGFMVITPNDNDFQKLVKANEEIGSSEGGDQGILNRGLCPNWFHVDRNDLHCGRLPWIYNVGAAYYEKYKTLQKMSKLQAPLVVHFVSEGKPWAVLAYEYFKGNLKKAISPEVFRDLGKQAEVHLLWREKFFKQTGQTPTNNKLLLAAVSGLPLPNKLSEINIVGGNITITKNSKNNNDNSNKSSSLLRKRREKVKKTKNEKTKIDEVNKPKIITSKKKNEKGRLSRKEKRTDL